VNLDAAALRGRELYGLLVDTIVPRPVAWVLTLSPDGVPNLAPFSFFNGVCARPPTLSVSVASKPMVDASGHRSFVAKDTASFARHHGFFCVHIAPATRREDVASSAVDHPSDVDVPALVGLKTQPGTWGPIPWSPDLPVAMECRLSQIVEVGDPVNHLLLGEVLGWHIRDELVDEDGRMPSDWDPLARLGVSGYAPPRSS
jgi:flavin reductase (DIM6/NTAB) family NADH-FMN oxidoreductase RutF